MTTCPMCGSKMKMSDAKLCDFVEGKTGTVDMEYQDYRDAVMECCRRLRAHHDNPIALDKKRLIEWLGLQRNGARLGLEVTKGTPGYDKWRLLDEVLTGIIQHIETNHQGGAGGQAM